MKMCLFKFPYTDLIKLTFLIIQDQHSGPAVLGEREGCAPQHCAAVGAGVAQPRVQRGGHGLRRQGLESHPCDHRCFTSLCHLMDRSVRKLLPIYHMSISENV